MIEKTKNTFRTKAAYFGITIDVLMVILIILNLLFLIFDWAFGYAFFRDFVHKISYEFFVYYRDVVHPDFVLYDFYFVAIFIAEIIIQWIISVVKKTHDKWWLYPFINWFDVLGCIPIGAFRWLRLLRIGAITIRLNKMEILNLRKTFVYKQFFAVYQLFVQEVADRALVKMIDAAQRGIKSETNSSVISDAIKPDQQELAKVLSAKLHAVIQSNYDAHRDDLKEQIELVIKNGFDKSDEMKKLRHIPLIGSRIVIKLEDLINDITFQLTDSLTSKLASDEVTRIVENIVNTSINALLEEKEEVKNADEDNQDLNNILKRIIDRALQNVKEDIGTNGKSKIAISEPIEDNLPSLDATNQV